MRVSPGLDGVQGQHGLSAHVSHLPTRLSPWLPVSGKWCCIQVRAAYPGRRVLEGVHPGGLGHRTCTLGLCSECLRRLCNGWPTAALSRLGCGDNDPD